MENMNELIAAMFVLMKVISGSDAMVMQMASL